MPFSHNFSSSEVPDWRYESEYREPRVDARLRRNGAVEPVVPETKSYAFVTVAFLAFLGCVLGALSLVLQLL